MRWALARGLKSRLSLGTRSGRRKLPPVGVFAPASDLQNDHQRSVVIDVVDDPVGANPDAPGPLLSPKLADSRGPRVLCQSLDGCRQPGQDFPWQSPQVLLG